MSSPPTSADPPLDDSARARLERRGAVAEYATIAWNVMEVFVTIGHGLPRIVGHGEWQHDGGDHRRQGRIGAEDEDAGRSEDRVGDQPDHGRVYTGDRGKPCQLGGRHPLRDQQSADDQPGDDVGPQPGPLVAAQLGHAGQPAQRTHARTALRTHICHGVRGIRSTTAAGYTARLVIEIPCDLCPVDRSINRWLRFR